VRGLLRPCRHHLDDELRERWRSHLCGLCLSLLDESGQSARLLTGYDVLLLSVLVEAQQGALPRAAAGRCALRGFRPASVVASSTQAMKLAAAGALLAGAAGLSDKIADADIGRSLRPVAQRSARSFRQTGARIATEVGLADTVFDDAEAAARDAETRPDGTLEELLSPSAEAVGELFAQTARVAHRPANESGLRRAGHAFGRLVHLADAIEDYAGDVAAGRFNPLVVTRTSAGDAYRLAQSLCVEIRAALSTVDMADPRLPDVMFGPVLTAAVGRLKPVERPSESVSSTGLTIGVAALTTTMLGVFGGGRWSRRGGYPQYGPGYGYGYGRGYRRGPSCCDLIACDCCISEGCSAASGDDVCCCCCP
jgi:Family of unknown function (DUF5685)